MGDLNKVNINHRKIIDFFLVVLLLSACLFVFLVNNSFLLEGDDWIAVFKGVLRKFGYYDSDGFSLSKGLHPISILSYSYGAISYLHQALRVLLYKYELMPFTEGSYRTYEALMNFIVMIVLFYLLYKNYGMSFAFLFIVFSCLLPRELSYNRAHGFYLARMLTIAIFIYVNKCLTDDKIKNTFLFYLSIILVFYSDSLAKIYFFLLFISLLFYLVYLKGERINGLKNIFYHNFFKGHRKYFILCAIIMGVMLILFNVYYREWLIKSGTRFRGLFNHVDVKAGEKIFSISLKQQFDVFTSFITGTNIVYFGLVLFSIAYSVYSLVKKKSNEHSILLIYSLVLSGAFYFQLAFFKFDNYSYDAQLDKSYYLFFPSICIVCIALSSVLKRFNFWIKRGILFTIFISMLYFAIPVVNGTANIPKPYGVPVDDKGYKAAAYIYRKYFEHNSSLDFIYTNISKEVGPNFYFGIDFNSYDQYEGDASIYFYETSSVNKVDTKIIENDLTKKSVIINDNEAVIVIYYNGDKSFQLKESYDLEELNTLFNNEYNTIEELF